MRLTSRTRVFLEWLFYVVTMTLAALGLLYGAKHGLNR